MNTLITRRNVVKLSAVGAMAAMFSGINQAPAFAHATDTAQQTYAAGTYTAEARGRWTPFDVTVVLGEHTIESVEIGDNRETPFIADKALTQIPADIVAYQSLAVDTYTGATITSHAVIEAVADCLEQAGGDVEALREAAIPQAEPALEEIGADIVVVGAGAAGMAAAVAAATSGARNVVVFEKTSNMGGNALVSGGFIQYPFAPESIRAKMTDGLRQYFSQTLQKGTELGVDPAIIESIQKDYDDYYAAGNEYIFDSPDFFGLDMYVQTGGTFESWRQSGEIYAAFCEWMTNLGFEWTPCVPIAGVPYPRYSTCAWTSGSTGAGLFEIFSDATEAQDLPITLLFSTPASELIVENGKVVGVVGMADDGTEYRVRGDRGVVMATGGYCGNSDMLHEYDTYWNFKEGFIRTDNAYGHTGDGLKMALAAGAAAAGTELTMCLPYVDLVDSSIQTGVAFADKLMMVNKEGKRFVDESADRYTLTRGVMNQTDETTFVISSANNTPVTDGVSQNGLPIDWLESRGQLFIADTPRELAEKCGIDPDAFQETFDAYNEYVVAGYDPDFGRMVFSEGAEMIEPPFYANPRTWAAHITMGGVAIDEQYRALDDAGQPVEGLYCVGEVANGLAGISTMADGMLLANTLFETEL